MRGEEVDFTRREDIHREVGVKSVREEDRLEWRRGEHVGLLRYHPPRAVFDLPRWEEYPEIAPEVPHVVAMKPVEWHDQEKRPAPCGQALHDQPGLAEGRVGYHHVASVMLEKVLSLAMDNVKAKLGEGRSRAPVEIKGFPDLDCA